MVLKSIKVLKKKFYKPIYVIKRTKYNNVSYMAFHINDIHIHDIYLFKFDYKINYSTGRLYPTLSVHLTALLHLHNVIYLSRSKTT